MATTLEDFARLLGVPSEDEHIEFKEAKSHFELDAAADYCIALANEGGGRLILGVTDAVPRQVVGTRAFQNPHRTAERLRDTIHLRVDVEEVEHPDGRVVILHAPPRPIGTPLARRGRFLMRSGSALVGMTSDQIRRIHEEGQPDFSAAICQAADLTALSPAGLQTLRQAWRRKSGNGRIDQLSDEQMLADLGLLRDGQPTYASLILVGSESAIAAHLPWAEIIFEYRSDEANIRHNERREFHEGFLLCHDGIWEAANLRNDVEHYQDGLWLLDIPVLNERVVREALLNAVSHRDYRLHGPVFVRQFPRKLEVVSPGGLPEGVTVDNILRAQVPRNPLLANVLEKCGLIERSGQGVDLMFEDCLREGKLLPDYSRTSHNQVYVTLPGEVRDPSFVRFLEAVDREKGVRFSIEDLIVLDLLKRDERVPEELASRLPQLLDAGVVDRRGRSRHILSQDYYRFVDQRGVYTRVAGLNRKKCKLLLLQHIEENRKEGSRMRDMMDVVPHLTRDQVRSII
jgi:ATP-dependent DNA helicase RecG